MSVETPLSRKPVRVLHFVTGGLSGATTVALDLVRAALETSDTTPLLVLRRKRRTDMQRIEAFRAEGIPLKLVNNATHLSCVLELASVCREFNPDVLVAHGFSDHLWGRYAGLLAKVPTLIHVEHNTRERYTWWRLKQALWLTKRTRYLVGVSEGVRQSLLQRGFPPEKTIAIPNGINLKPFEAADEHPYLQRQPDIIMVSRFTKQKDQSTLLRALHVLKQRGYTPQLTLVGQGKLLAKAQTLATQLGIDEQVHFLGYRSDVPELLFRHKIAVHSAHYEGMPLSMLECMAAGCAVVASAVPGVKEVIDEGRTGLLVPLADPDATADALERLLTDEKLGAQLAQQARARALEEHSKELMNKRYHDLFVTLASNRSSNA